MSSDRIRLRDLELGQARQDVQIQGHDVQIQGHDDNRLRDLEVGQARHHEQLADHERVLRALESHLEDLVAVVSGIERKALILSVILLISSGNAANLAKLVGLS